MSNKAIVIAIIVIALFIAGVVLIFSQSQQDATIANQDNTEAQTSPSPSPEPNQQSKPKIALVELNDSGISGIAQITDDNGKAEVNINIQGGEEGAVYPVHIHEGTCDNLGDVKHPLVDIEEGNSDTLLNISVEELVSQLPLAINVHKSAEEISEFVACGDIQASALTVSEKNIQDTKAEAKVFELIGKNYEFSQKEIRVKKGDKVKIVLNVAEGFHDWVIDEFNASTNRISKGETASVEFTADKVGTFEYYCSVGDHRRLGMRGNLIVEE